MQHLLSSPYSEMESSSNVPPPTKNGESSVQEMVTKYSKIKTLHPVVSRICEFPRNQDVLRKSLQHDLSLIRGRSSRLDDHEISIAQKAYMLLMRRPEDRLGGIELYVQEIIGLRHVEATESFTCLQTAMKTREIFLHRMNPSQENFRFAFLPQQEEEEEPHELLEPFLFLLSSQADSSASVDDQTHEDQAHLQAIPKSRPSSFIDSDSTICNYSNRAITTNNMHGELFLSPISESFELTSPDQNTDSLAEHHDSSSGIISDPTDPKLQRLWSLFLEARTDFNLECNDNFRRTTAAKFLRDTIENCLSYISSYPSSAGNYPEEATVRETLLKDTLKLAIEAAERGSGGRKRRFDVEAKKKTSATQGAGGKSVTRRGGRVNGSRAAAHGNGNGGKKQAVYHAAGYKGYQ